MSLGTTREIMHKEISQNLKNSSREMNDNTYNANIEGFGLRTFKKIPGKMPSMLEGRFNQRKDNLLTY